MISLSLSSPTSFSLSGKALLFLSRVKKCPSQREVLRSLGTTAARAAPSPSGRAKWTDDREGNRQWGQEGRKESRLKPRGETSVSTLRDGLWTSCCGCVQPTTHTTKFLFPSLWFVIERAREEVSLNSREVFCAVLVKDTCSYLGVCLPCRMPKETLYESVIRVASCYSSEFWF